MEENINTTGSQSFAGNLEKDSSFSVKDFLFIFLNNWYWFLISIVICVGIAMFSYKVKPRIYQQSALILIRDSMQSNTESVSSFLGKDRGQSRSFRLDNEMYVLRSSTLMENVVRRLNLQTSYRYTSMFKKYLYFHDTPITVDFFSNNSDYIDNFYFEINVTPKSENEYRFCLVNDWGESDKKTAKFGDVVKINNSISFTVNKTGFFSKENLGKEIIVNRVPALNRAKMILGGFSVGCIDNKTGILRLTMNTENLEMSKEILDTLIVVYNEDANKDKQQKTQRTEEFILDRIDLIYGELETVESRIENIRRSNDIPYLGNASDIYVERGNKYNDDAAELETELGVLNFLKANLEDPSKRNDFLPLVNVSNSALQRLIEKYNEEKLKYDELVSINGENNPETKRRAHALESSRSGIIFSISQLLQSTRMRLRNARSQESMAKTHVNIISSQERAVTDVMRQQKIKESLYLYLLNKREEIALSLDISEDVAKTIEAASQSARVSPDKNKYMSMGFGIGFLIPFVILILIHVLDDRLKSKLDVGKNTTVPILCEIPSKQKEQQNDEIVVSESGVDLLTEAFRIMCSNTQFFLRSDDKKVIQFVSSVPKEGKTYTTLNFAITMGYLGKKTVLVDLDCRKRSLSKIIDRPNKNGVINYLISRESNIDSIINHSVFTPNLDYIVCEKIAPNVSQLLLSEKYDTFIEELRSRYDYVIIDSTPSQVVADPIIINRNTDLTVYVMRINVFNKRMFPFIQTLYDQKKLNNMAIVITDVPIPKHSFGYSYGYGHGYGYGYGYSYGYGYGDSEGGKKSKHSRKKN